MNNRIAMTKEERKEKKRWNAFIKKIEKAQKGGPITEIFNKKCHQAVMEYVFADIFEKAGIKT